MSAENTAIVLIDLYNDFLHTDVMRNSAIVVDLIRSNVIENIKKRLAFARSTEHQLRQRDIQNLVLAGLEPHTCFESTDG